MNIYCIYMNIYQNHNNMTLRYLFFINYWCDEYSSMISEPVIRLRLACDCILTACNSSAQ